MDQPLVFVLDLDGTVIGNVLPQTSIYELKGQKIKLNYTNKDLFNRFDNGLLRPYFDSFVKQIKRRIPYAEFFIYTASDDKWGAFIINALEKHISFQFNKPFFTRKHCYFNEGNCIRKCTQLIVPHIKRSLQRKYARPIDLTNRILLIDNSQVYDAYDKKNLLLCPSYKYAYVENLPAIISEDTFHRHKALILDKLHRYFPTITHGNIDSYIEFQKIFYTHYVQALHRHAIPNNDRFWFFLLRLLEIKNINVFTPRTIQYINSKLSKRLVSPKS